MRKIKRSAILMLSIFLFLTSGCANVNDVSQEAVALKTETAAEKETEAEQDKAEAETVEEAEPILTEKVEEKEEEVTTEGVTETEIVIEAETTEEELEVIEYEVTPMEEVSMYASNAVNVRIGPSTDFERVGALKHGQEVKVVGQASTGWYEIAYGEEMAYVSDKYLQSEPVPVEQIQQAAANNAPVPPTTNIILIGDSRTAEMKSCVGENSCIWIAEHSKGIKWFMSDAVPAAEPYIEQGTKIVINLGANDPQKADTYIQKISEVAAAWTGRGATVYYASVGPCHENPYHTNDEAVEFNTKLQNGLSGVCWIDLYTHLVNGGFATRENDGFHYDPQTYASMYTYYMKCIN